MSTKDPQKAAKEGLEAGTRIVQTLLNAISDGTRSIFSKMLGGKDSTDPNDPSRIHQPPSENNVGNTTADDLSEEDPIDPSSIHISRNEHGPPSPKPLLFQKPRHDAEEEVKDLINSIKHINEAPDDASKPSIKSSGPPKPSPPKH